jgi:hypothetical protein
MSATSRPLTGAARSVLREIDRELSRLDKWEKAAARERELLLSARAALIAKDGAGPRLRRSVSQHEVAAYLGKHPGSSEREIAEALQAVLTSVSTHLHRGSPSRYECRDEAWYVRPQNGRISAGAAGTADRPQSGSQGAQRP